jgi:hypothetical protein
MMRSPAILLVLVALGCGKANDAAAPAVPVGAETPAEAPAEAVAAVADPCTLFTADDFVAVFGTTAMAPDRIHDSAWVSCSYGFSEYRASDTAYELELRVITREREREPLEYVTKLQGRAVDGIGDRAYLMPAAGPDSHTFLIVFRKKTIFELGLLEPPKVGATRVEAELVAAARRVVARL